ncbi:MAG: MoxR family ATPase [Patescibacteria group bacterium]|nr:MoxR family ATPase [Patescibacteria group bacterium]
MSKKEIVEVTPASLANMLDVLFEIRNISPFIWGGPGIGKSSIVSALAKKKNMNFVDIRLSMMEPSTIMGIMIPDITNATSKWLPPSFFKNDGPTLYFFDEFNSAPPTIQAVAYQIILDRKIGPHSLNDTDFIVAAGNTVSDKGITFKMPNPLANRFVHLNLKVNFDDFYNYAVKNKLHQHVVGYLNYQKGDLYVPDYSPEVRGFPTPRSWEFVSRILYKVGDRNIDILPLVAGAVGEGVAYKFLSYRRVAESVVNINEIITGKIKEMRPKNIDVCYATITALCYTLADYYEAYKTKKEISKKLYDTYCDNFMGYLLNPKNEIQPEMVIMAVRTCLTALDLDINVDTPNWDAFFRNETYARPIMNAFSGLDKKVGS